MNKKIVVTIANYQKLAMKTCLKSAKNESYAEFNLLAEVHELLAKVESARAKRIRDGAAFDEVKHKAEVKDELGDCFWQVALKCVLQNKKFEQEYKKVKKEKCSGMYLINFWISENEAMQHQITALSVVIKSLINICEIYKLRPIDCLYSNIKKLASRQKRGVIKGNGDNR